MAITECLLFSFSSPAMDQHWLLQGRVSCGIARCELAVAPTFHRVHQGHVPPSAITLAKPSGEPAVALALEGTRPYGGRRRGRAEVVSKKMHEIGEVLASLEKS